MVKDHLSRQWIRRHVRDPFVKKAHKCGYRARSAFKLLEIQEQYQCIKPGMHVLELGCAPGGWTQVIVECLQGRGSVTAIDYVEMCPMAGANILQYDVSSEALLRLLQQQYPPFDLILSDMAPSFSGQKMTDRCKMEALLESALFLAYAILKKGGNFLVKSFHDIEMIKELRRCFDQVNYVKPRASRLSSREIYILAKKFSWES